MLVNAFLLKRSYRAAMARSSEIAKTQAEVLPDTLALLDRLRNTTTVSLVDVRNVELAIFPQVFPPTTETELLLAHLPEDLAGKRILDLTTGTGVIAVHAGLKGAHGLATDINPHAVINARLNSMKHHVPLEVKPSDLFTKIPQEEQFDDIFVTPPYYDKTPHDDLEHAVFGGKQFIEDLFAGLNGHLTPTGKILMTYAEWAGEDALTFLEQSIKDNGYIYTIIGRETNKTGKLTYRLYEISQTSDEEMLSQKKE